MKGDKLIPKIRFKEFENDEAWELRKLGDMCTVKTGYAFNSNDFDDNGEFLVITNGNIQKDSPYVNGLIGNKIDIKENVILKEYVLNKNEVLVTMDGTVGRTAKVMEERQILAQRVGRLIAKSEPEFLYQYLNTGNFFNEMALISHGGTIKHISLTEISDYMDYIPSSNKEQQRIGSFFKNLDNLITLHQRKLKKLKEIKSAYLSEMFPKEGQKYPKRRFSGFTDPWEQCKLYEVAEFNPKSELPDEFEYVDLESVVGTEMISHRTETKLSAPSRAQRLAKTGDIFYQTVRPYQKNNYLFIKSDKNYVFSTGYAQMRPNIDTNFLMSFLQTEAFVNVVLDNCTGTSYPAINSTDLSNLEILLPISRDEQRKLGEVFKNLDNLITLQQRKLEKLENLKKAYLNEMFV